MLIGIDGIPLCAPKTGVGHYTFELARGLAEAAPDEEFALLSPHRFHYPQPDENSWPANLGARQAQTRRWERFWFAVGLTRYLRRYSFDLFHGTNYEVPLGWRGPSVLTIHDLSLFRFPQTHEKRLVWRARWRWPLMTRAAQMIITPTEYIRREVLERLKIAPDKVIAIHEAARPAFTPLAREATAETRRRLGVEDDFILFVGTVEPRKNLHTLVKAFGELLRQTNLRPQLVIAGQRGWLMEDFFAGAGAAERVHFTGYLTENELRELYSSCRVFVYPSLYEGFGLPPLEAMACGAPVVASRIGSHTEVLGDAAQLFEPENTDELAAILSRLLQDENERRALREAGRQKAAQYSWPQAARQTLEVYAEAMRRAFARQT
jgi:glycosyltransferase involved in cell wall biosynthesis